MKRTLAVLVGPKKFDFVEEEIPALKDDEILLKSISLGLCHSDVPGYLGTSTFGFDEKGIGVMFKEIPYPTLIGHEPVFVVEDVGKCITKFKAGDYVTGLIMDCSATHIISDENAQLLKIPPTNKPIETCLGEPMMCVSNIAQAAVPKLGDNIAVIGCGYMGLSVMATLNNKVNEIVAIDLDDARLELAKKYGATRTMNPAKDDVVNDSFDLTDGRFYDCVIEISGSLKGLALALKLSSISGRGRILAPSVYSKEVMWDPEMAVDLMFRSPIIHVVHPWYATDYMRTLKIGIDAYVKGILPTDEMITHRIPFEDIGKGFELLINNEPGYIKGIITY